MKIQLTKINFLLLISLVLFACPKDSDTPTSANSPSNLPATVTSINYKITGDFYIALNNTNILLKQEENFGNQSNFYISPNLPNGLSIDITNGDISGTPTTASLPTLYTIIVNINGKNYIKTLSLGVAPSEVWITNINASRPYELTAYVVGNGAKQISDWIWSSSDTSLATVNDGVVSLLSTPTGGTVVISASKNGYSNGVSFIAPSTSLDYGVSGNLYIALANANVLLEQKTNLGSQASFSISPSLPSGLTLDTTRGSISGTPTTTSLPSLYTITANANGKSYIKMLSLGVAPSEVWITNINASRPYELTTYVVGDGAKQISDWTWGSSDTSLATVNNGVINFLSTPTGGTVVISASKNSYSNGISFTVSKVEEVNGQKIITDGKNVHLTINSGTKVLNTGQFKSKGLTSVVIPNSVTDISSEAFYSNLLTSLVIPNSVINIGGYAFIYNKLTNLSIPNSVKTIGGSAFYGNKLINVVIPNSVTNIGDAAFYSNRLTSVVIPNSVTYVGNLAFYNNKLANVVIGNSVTTIGIYAFNVNRLTSVVIPDSVTNIGNSAFASNPNLLVVNLKQSLYDNIGSRRDTIFGTQVTSYIKRP